MADMNGGIWTEKSDGTFEYRVEGSLVATVSGLNNGLGVNEDGTIDEIEVSGSSIILSKKAFKTGGDTIPKLTNAGSANYTLDVAEDCEPQDAVTWTQGVNGYTLATGGMTDGYKLDENNNIVYVPAESGDKTNVAFVTGLKKDLAQGGSISGIEVDTGKSTIKITNSNVLAEGDTKIENYDGYDYSFKFGDNIKGASEADITWKYTASSGKLEFKSEFTAGFSITDEGKTIHTTAAGSADATITGLAKDLTPTEDGSFTEVTFEGGVFKIADTALNATTVKLSQTKTSSETYKIALRDENTPEPVWTADKGTAKYVRTFAKESYSTATDGKSITYYSRDTSVTVAEISGLTTDITTENIGEYVTANEDGTISIDKEAFKAGNITLKSTAYTKLVDANAESEEDSWGVKTDAPALKYASGKATVVTHSDAGWAYKTTTSKGVTTTDYKTLTYIKAVDPVSATVSGLPTKVGKTAISYAVGDDGALYLADAEGKATDTKILKFDVPVEADGDNAAQTGKITLYPGAFENSPSKFTIGAKENYEFQFATGVDSTGNSIGEADADPDSDSEAWDPTPKTVGAHWKTDGKGKATIVAGTTAGYNFAKNSKTGAVDTKTVSVIKENYTTSATISGLMPYSATDGTGIPAGDYYEEGSIGSDSALAGLQITKVATDSENGVITISDDRLLEYLVKDGTNGETVSSGKKLTLGSKDNYKFEFGTDSGIAEPDPKTPVWLIDKKNGKATYQADVTAGYVISDGKTISYSNAVEGKKIVEVTGLDKEKLGTVFAEEFGDNNTATISAEDFEQYISVEGKTVTVNSDAFLSATTKLSDTKAYSFAVGDSENITKAGTPTDERQWTLSGGTTAKLYNGGGAAGYEVNSKGELVYKSATVDEKNLVATITGLKKGVKEADLAYIDVDTGAGTLTLGESVLGTTAVNLTGNYMLATKGVKASVTDDPYWSVSKGTANYKQDTSKGYYTSNGGKTINYSTGTTATLFTIKGLGTSVTKLQLKNNVEVDSNIVTIKNDSVLNKANVTFTGTGYTLAIDKGVTQKSENVTEWSVSKGTATYKNYDKGYYTLSANALTYSKDGKATTYATIKGLNTAATDAEINAHVNIDPDTNVITIDDEALVAAPTEKTTVTLANGTGKAYKLALKPAYTDEEGEEHAAQAVEYDTPKFGAVSNKKSLLTAEVSKAGYEIDSAGIKLTYMPEKVTKSGQEVNNSVTLATVSNVADEKGLELETAEDGTYTGKIIVSKSALGDSNLMLGKNDNYTFKLNETELEAGDFNAKIDEAPTPTLSSGKYTLKGTTGNSYALKDGKTIAVTKGVKNNGATLVTINGLSKSYTIDDFKNQKDGKVFTLSDEDIATVQSGKQKTVTVDSAYGYSFEFAADYTNASIVGDKNNDAITVAGSGLTINTKKGNDYVDLVNAEAGSNIFFYASGDGDDVIANFSSTDTIKINEAKKDINGTKVKVEVAKEDSDAVVTITKGKVVGTITLKDYTSDVSNIGIFDKNGEQVTPTTSASSSSLFYDDNYGTYADLSGIVSNGSDAGLLGDLNTNKDYTSIAPQTVVYGGKK